MVISPTVSGWADMVDLVHEREALWTRARLCRAADETHEEPAHSTDRSEGTPVDPPMAADWQA